MWSLISHLFFFVLVQAVAETKGTVDDFFGGLEDILNLFVKCRKQYNPSSGSLLRSEWPRWETVKLPVVVDFQERVSVREQEELQSQNLRSPSLY